MPRPSTQTLTIHLESKLPVHSPLVALVENELDEMIRPIGLQCSAQINGCISDRFPNGGEVMSAAARINCPVLFLMQLEDELFDRNSYLDLFDALATDDKRIHANPGLHPEVPAEEINDAFDFMCHHLARNVAPSLTRSSIAE